MRNDVPDGLPDDPDKAWSLGYAAGFKAALQAVVTVQLSFAELDSARVDARYHG